LDLSGLLVSDVAGREGRVGIDFLAHAAVDAFDKAPVDLVRAHLPTNEEIINFPFHRQTAVGREYDKYAHNVHLYLLILNTTLMR